MSEGNTVVCPGCGHLNIAGLDRCDNCHFGLSAFDVPATAQPETESQLNLALCDIQLSTPITIDITATAGQAIALMRGAKTGALVVVEDGQIAGMFTDRDVLKKVAGGAVPSSTPLRTLMTPDPVVLRETDTMAVALNKMGTGGFRHIPVTRDGEVVAVVGARDVLKWVLGQYFHNS